MLQMIEPRELKGAYLDEEGNLCFEGARSLLVIGGEITYGPACQGITDRPVLALLKPSRRDMVSITDFLREIGQPRRKRTMILKIRKCDSVMIWGGDGPLPVTLGDSGLFDGAVCFRVKQRGNRLRMHATEILLNKRLSYAQLYLSRSRGSLPRRDSWDSPPPRDSWGSPEPPPQGSWGSPEPPPYESLEKVKE